MNAQHSIVIEPPESAKAPMWSARCSDLGFSAEANTPAEAFICLLDGIRMAQEYDQLNQPKQRFEFSIPTFA